MSVREGGVQRSPSWGSLPDAGGDDGDRRPGAAAGDCGVVVVVCSREI
jgi:hypothetical protein